MNTETYTDRDGNRCSLDEMCRREPEWAASTIRFLSAKSDRQKDALDNYARAAYEAGAGDPRAPLDGESAVMLCPFHAEKTPSLLVKGGRYRCLGCGASGDVTGFDIRLAPPKSGSVG